MRLSASIFVLLTMALRDNISCGSVCCKGYRRLVSRKLPDGTDGLLRRGVMVLGSWIKGHRNLNVLWDGRMGQRSRTLWSRNTSLRL